MKIGKIILSSSQHNLSHRSKVVSFVVAVTLVGLVAIGVGASVNRNSIKTFASNSKILATGASRFPSTACSSSAPTDLLLPVAALSHMALQVPSFASGGQALGGLGLPGTASSSLASAAILSEHFINTQAPSSAIQSSDSFNVVNPMTITSFDEGITGFSDPAAEAKFFGYATPSGPAPEINLNGQLQNENVTVLTNVSGFSQPNVVVETSLPGSDAPGMVEITIEAGNTVYGFTFEGGASLTLNNVRGIVTSSIARVNGACGTADIMH